MSTKKDYRRISMFIHGWWGAGKSWLSASAPAPRLVLDTEGGYHDTAGKHILWNPQEPLPQELDKETSVIVDVNEWSVVESVMNILRSGDHPFETIKYPCTSYGFGKLQRIGEALELASG